MVPAPTVTIHRARWSAFACTRQFLTVEGDGWKTGEARPLALKNQ
jgi:hypothetical protein